MTAAGPSTATAAAELGDRVVPGLDRHRLLALRRPRRPDEELHQRIRAHLDAADGYVAFSGGKDSTVVLHLTMQVEPNAPVVFFDSGLEFPETYAYLQRISDHLGVTLTRIPARHTTLQVLHASGLWDHHRPTTAVPDLHDVLIREPAAEAHAAHGPGELWGVRAAESRGRAATYANALRNEVTRTCIPGRCCTTIRQRRDRHGGLIRRVDGTTAYGPIWDWTEDEVWGYLTRHDLPPNPLYAKLRALGAPAHSQRVAHMIDGSCLENGRATWLRRGWPDLFEELAAALPRLREYV